MTQQSVPPPFPTLDQMCVLVCFFAFFVRRSTAHQRQARLGQQQQQQQQQVDRDDDGDD